MKDLHIALLDVLVGMLIDAVLLPALPVNPKEPAHGHPGLVVLMKKSARIPFHAQAPQPVPTHRLPEAPTLVAAGAGTCGIDSCLDCGGGGGGGGGVVRRGIGGGKEGGRVRVVVYGGGGGGGCGGVEAALEVEAEGTFVVH